MQTAAMKEPRLTSKVERVLLLLKNGPRHGWEIQRITGLFTGTLYPLLMRLEDAGWLTSEWEVLDPSEAGRPRRRYYSMTAKGAIQLP